MTLAEEEILPPTDIASDPLEYGEANTLESMTNLDVTEDKALEYFFNKFVPGIANHSEVRGPFGLRCFSGEEASKLMVNDGIVVWREQAADIGNYLIEKGFICPLSSNKDSIRPFLPDRYLFYRIVEDDDRGRNVPFGGRRKSLAEGASPNSGSPRTTVATSTIPGVLTNEQEIVLYFKERFATSIVDRCQTSCGPFGPLSFSGEEAAKLMMEHDICEFREQAMDVGNILIEKGLIAPVPGNMESLKPFQPDRLLRYRIVRD